MKVTHKMSLMRIGSILITPLVITIFSLFMFSIGKDGSTAPLLVFCTVVFLPYLCIIGSYWKYALGVVLNYENKNVTIQYPNETIKFSYDEIQTIIEYHGFAVGRVTRDFKYWCIQTKKGNFIITILTVSPLDFERMFWNKIEEKPVLWPSIKKHPC